MPPGRGRQEGYLGHSGFDMVGLPASKMEDLVVSWTGYDFFSRCVVQCHLPSLAFLKGRFIG